ncbi:LysR family transcriptional regulator [Paenibacillus endoradicis]|uniref:LysR family transcriptional regulator n=1 Tax=Paenibacillus endoradicis TaxID=2972487 RepID=UPI0021597607|nr:LysR family transcriptional regulator [Paenibacillus endoradicis]MCR8658985.1 LysR family transcriptional regulator [Paenibacillus endoradicis]
MDTKHQVFLTIIETGSFSKAAERLYMTQPAVSQYIKQLETEIGVSLFDRSTKKLHVTGTGKIVERYVRQLAGMHVEMEQAIHDYLHEVKGALRIGASYSFGEYVLPNILASFLKEYTDVTPKIDIHNTFEIANNVAQQQIDIGIVEGYVEHPQLLLQKIAQDEMVVVAHRPDINIDEQSWIVRERGSGTREAMNTFLTKFQLKPKVMYEYGSTQLIKGTVMAGIGISYLSKWTVQRELEEGSLFTINEAEFNMVRDFYCIQRKETVRSKVFEAFIQHLHKCCSNL